MKSERLNRITAGVVFISALTVYLITVAPTISFWDSAEFIAAAHTVGIPHPPGAPLLILTGRVMSLIPFYDFRGGGFESIAWRINLINVFAGAFAVMLAYLLTVKLITRVHPFQNRFLYDWPVYFGGSIAALSAAFSDQVWENSIETETYMPGLLLSMIALWLVFRWEERKNEPGSALYLFMAAYLVGLGYGFHLYAMIVIPSIILLIMVNRIEWFKNFWTWAAIFILILGFWIITTFGGLGLLYLSAGLLMLSAPFIVYRMYSKGKLGKNRVVFAGIFICAAMFAAGNSVYPTVIVRASKNPAINENNPDNWERFNYYVTRKQYGQGSMLKEAFTRKADLSYQFGYMYLRYLLAQFPDWGPSFPVSFTSSPDNQTVIQKNAMVSVFLWLIIFLGIGLHAFRDIRHFGVISLYFLLTSIGLILYLNMQNPEVRERDYFFIGSFYIITVWLGIGVYKALDITRTLADRFLPASVRLPSTIIGAIVLASIIPAAVMSRSIDPDNSNWRVHDRSKDYIPLDYALDILNSCDHGGILFTSGDNDTYPLWYAQQVKGVRRDVKVVNVSLLTGNWYPKQLREGDYGIELGFSNSELDSLIYGETEASYRFRMWSAEPSLISLGKLEWEMPPSNIWVMNDGRRIGMLTSAHYMVAHIIQMNFEKRPIYFVIGIDHSSRIGLNRNLSLEGLVFRVISERAESGYHVNIDRLSHNLYNVYSYRSLGDTRVYKSTDTANLVSNYTFSFADLAAEYLELGDHEKALEVLRDVIEKCNPDRERREILLFLFDQHGYRDEALRILEPDTRRQSGFLRPDDNLQLHSSLSYVQSLFIKPETTEGGEGAV